MASPPCFYLFGEATDDLYTDVRSLVVQSKRHPYLALFLDNAGNCLRQALSEVPNTEKPPRLAYSNINLLNESSKGGHGHSGIQFALVCVNQIGQYIRFVNQFEVILLALRGIRYAAKSHGSDQSFSESHVIGVSIGQLPAAAITLSPNIVSLIPLAVRIILIGFRLGCYIHSSANIIEQTSSEKLGRSWAFEISGVSEETLQQALHEYNNKHVSRTLPC